MTNKEFDSWLQQRHVEEVSPDLAGRIMLAAEVTKQESSKWWQQWQLAQPAYALASIAVIAVILVVENPLVPQAEMANFTDEELFSEVFYYPDDSLF